MRKQTQTNSKLKKKCTCVQLLGKIIMTTKSFIFWAYAL